MTTSLLARAALVYVFELAPTLEPFNFHWYAGELPPKNGVAVNVTEVPLQTLLLKSLEVTKTKGVQLIFTVVDILLLDAVAEV